MSNKLFITATKSKITAIELHFKVLLTVLKKIHIFNLLAILRKTLFPQFSYSCSIKNNFSKQLRSEGCLDCRFTNF